MKTYNNMYEDIVSLPKLSKYFGVWERDIEFYRNKFEELMR